MVGCIDVKWDGIHGLQIKCLWLNTCQPKASRSLNAFHHHLGVWNGGKRPWHRTRCAPRRLLCIWEPQGPPHCPSFAVCGTKHLWREISRNIWEIRFAGFKCHPFWHVSRKVLWVWQKNLRTCCFFGGGHNVMGFKTRLSGLKTPPPIPPNVVKKKDQRSNWAQPDVLRPFGLNAATGCNCFFFFFFLEILILNVPQRPPTAASCCN